MNSFSPHKHGKKQNIKGFIRQLAHWKSGKYLKLYLNKKEVYWEYGNLWKFQNVYYKNPIMSKKTWKIQQISFEKNVIVHQMYLARNTGTMDLFSNSRYEIEESF